MTSEGRAPGALGRAEAASRQVVLQLGLGVASYVVGGLLSAGATSRLGDRLGAIESPALLWTLGWLLQRLWLWAVLPLAGWGAGRFLRVRPARFALQAGLAGELFSLLLTTAMDGLDLILEEPLNVVARLFTLGVGLTATAVAARAGLRAAAASDEVARRAAEARQAEYAEFLRAAGGAAAPRSPEEPPRPPVAPR